jgi:4-amino-4-deoxy-L-arabinose transferase-like glycosyltransferase
MATTPLFVVQATFPQDIIAQLFAVSLSFWSFYSAAHCERPGWLMFAAGVAAAFGWLTIEISRPPSRRISSPGLRVTRE